MKSLWRVSPPVPWAAPSGTEMLVRLLAPQEQPAAIHSLWSNQSCQTMCKAAMLISFLRAFPVPGGKHHTMFRSIFFNWHTKLKRSLLIAWYILITLAYPPILEFMILHTAKQPGYILTPHKEPTSLAFFGSFFFFPPLLPSFLSFSLFFIYTSYTNIQNSQCSFPLPQKWKTS